MDRRPLNIIVSGVGGQGTVLAGRLLAQCALDSGAFVRGAETIGMAQRGGSVLGHVRIVEDDKNSLPGLASPLIPRGEAQLLIGFEPAETLRAYSFCNPESLIVTAAAPLSPPTASLQRLEYDGRAQLDWLEREADAGNVATLVSVDNDAITAALGFEKTLNVVLLGAALAVLEASRHNARALSYTAMQRTIEEIVNHRFIEPNLQALEIGYRLPCT